MANKNGNDKNSSKQDERRNEAPREYGSGQRYTKDKQPTK